MIKVLVKKQKVEIIIDVMTVEIYKVTLKKYGNTKMNVVKILSQFLLLVYSIIYYLYQYKIIFVSYNYLNRTILQMKIVPWHSKEIQNVLAQTIQHLVMYFLKIKV